MLKSAYAFPSLNLELFHAHHPLLQYLFRILFTSQISPLRIQDFRSWWIFLFSNFSDSRFFRKTISSSHYVLIEIRGGHVKLLPIDAFADVLAT